MTLVNYAATNVRLFFRVYFIIFTNTIPLIGNACSSGLVKLRLLQGKPVPLPQMLGWLSNLEIVTTTWSLRALPGPFTLLMVIASLVALASDLVSQLIVPTTVPDRCPFGTGMVLSPNSPFAAISSTSLPNTVAAQAQLISLSNGGLQGIYTKVNNASNFRATDEDILGFWTCTQSSTSYDYPVTKSANDIGPDLANHGFLYTNQTAVSDENALDTSFEHLVFVDSSDNTFGHTWDVKFAISTNNTASNTNTVLGFTCKMSTSTWLASALQRISTSNTFPRWIQSIQGSCYSGIGTPARSDLSGILERTLNQLVMVAAGSNTLLDSSQASSTQGCVTARTKILWEVLALAAITAVMNIGLILLWVVLLVMVSKQSHHENKDSDAVPGDLLSWATYAVNTSGEAKEKVKHIKGWRFVWSDIMRKFTIQREDDHVEEVQLLSK